jgi:hypothetical protein
LASFFEDCWNSQHIWASFYNGQGYASMLTKYIGLHFGPIFFCNSSGHPGWQEERKKSVNISVCANIDPVKNVSTKERRLRPIWCRWEVSSKVCCTIGKKLF